MVFGGGGGGVTDNNMICSVFLPTYLGLAHDSHLPTPPHPFIHSHLIFHSLLPLRDNSIPKSEKVPIATINLQRFYLFPPILVVYMYYVLAIIGGVFSLGS